MLQANHYSRIHLQRLLVDLDLITMLCWWLTCCMNLNWAFGRLYLHTLYISCMLWLQLGIWWQSLITGRRALFNAFIALHSWLTCRFHLVPTFGCSTIRQFCSNMSEMKKLAAQNYEDILQVCAVTLKSNQLTHLLAVHYTHIWWTATWAPYYYCNQAAFLTCWMAYTS